MSLQRIVRILLALAILAGGFGVKHALDATRPKPKEKPRAEQGELVEVVPVTLETRPIHVRAQGRVVPARQLTVQPEVTGRIRWLSPSFVQGGRLSKGEVMLRIDPRDYQLAAEAQKASVDRSRLELRVEQSRKAIAEQEVRLLRGGQASDLARREPQLRTAQNALAAAEAALERANRLVAKTTLRAPFNAVVLKEQAEVGQLVAPAAPLGTIAGTDHFWVQVSIPVSDLSWIALPGVNAKEGDGAHVRITQDVGDGTIVRQGRVLRLAADLDPAGQMARVIVEIDDPLGLHRVAPLAPGESGLPLLLGAFVDVEIDAGTLKDVAVVPRRAVRDGGKVYLAGPDDTLVAHAITPIWREASFVLVRDLEPGARLIVSRIAVPVPGMKLRVIEAKAPEASQSPPPAGEASERDLVPPEAERPDRSVARKKS